MPAFTTRLNLYKPGGGSDGILPDEAVDIAKINSNMDAIDAAIGAPGYTSTTRPSTPYDGQLIKETDTKRVMRYSQSGTTWEEVVSPGQGATTIRPSSIANTGGTAVINTDGSVSVTGVTSISLNGVFAAAIADNYELVFDFDTETTPLNFRLRAANTDNNAANSYLLQTLTGDAAASSATTGTTTNGVLVPTSPAAAAGSFRIHGPALNRHTRWEGMSIGYVSTTSARVHMVAGAHTVAFQADGITLFSTNPLTGKFFINALR